MVTWTNKEESGEEEGEDGEGCGVEDAEEGNVHCGEVRGDADQGWMTGISEIELLPSDASNC